MEPKIDLDEALKKLNDASYEYATNSFSLNASDTITVNGHNYPNTITGSSVYVSPGYGAVPNVTIGAGSNTSPYSVTGGPYTISGGAGVTGISPWATYNPAPKIKLDGEGADIEVNGWSLIDAIQKIEERLNILHPNKKLEAEWEELRELGNRYRELEQHIKDKQATWDRLKAMTPPVVE